MNPQPLAPQPARQATDGDDVETSVLRGRLLARIRRLGYEVVEQVVRVGPLTLPFTRIADPDVVLDRVADEEDRRERASGRRTLGDDLHLPYWAELWDSAGGVGQWLARGSELRVQGSGEEEEEGGSCASPSTAEPDASPCVSALNSEPRTPNPPNVLDLGCGMGLAGTVAAALGARVTFADLEPPALLFAQLNSLPYRHRVRTRRLNWRTDRLGEQFDLILGADILYERAQWEYLEPFWRAHLAPGGLVLLGEPGRQTGEMFVEWIQRAGWTLTQTEEHVPSRERPVRLFHLRRPRTPAPVPAR